MAQLTCNCSCKALLLTVRQICYSLCQLCHYRMFDCNCSIIHKVRAKTNHHQKSAHLEHKFCRCTPSLHVPHVSLCSSYSKAYRQPPNERFVATVVFNLSQQLLFICCSFTQNCQCIEEASLHLLLQITHLQHRHDERKKHIKQCTFHT